MTENGKDIRSDLMWFLCLLERERPNQEIMIQYGILFGVEDVTLKMRASSRSVLHGVMLTKSLRKCIPGMMLGQFLHHSVNHFKPCHSFCHVGFMSL